MTKSSVTIAVTGIDWMGGGIGSIETAMRQLFQDARREILLTVYTVTSSADMLFDWLEMALGRGVEVKMIVNRLNEQAAAVNIKMRFLQSTYPHFHLCDFASEEHSDLHAKLIVADREKAIVGSSNLSRRGLLTNYEFALTVEGEVAAEIARVVDRLIAKS